MKKYFAALGIIAALGACKSTREGCVERFAAQSPTDSYGKFAPPEIEARDGKFSGSIDGRFFLHDTAIAVRDGDTLDVRAGGEIYWGWDDARGGPEQTPKTWGLYMLYGGEDNLNNPQMYRYIGSRFSGRVEFDEANKGNALPIMFVIPEGDDRTEFFEEFYRDNSGSFNVEFDVIRGTGDADAGHDD